MRVKRFEARSMPEALSLVRDDFGDRALILETKRIRGGLLSLGAGERIEVLAAVEDAPRPADSRLAELHTLLQRKASTRGELVASRLAESGLTESLVSSILAACEPDLADARLASETASRIAVSAPVAATGCARIALVGPTGVGKTTTIAKLAARYALTERKKVALITMDTYRIGAVEQIRTYARVMGLPLEVVQSPEEMASAVAAHADKDLLLIDTIGRSPHKALQLAEIKAFLNAADPVETHLVLAAPGGLGYLFEAAESFSVIGTNRLIVTKLDESPRWGVIASLTERTGLPVSFVTDGQEVPRNLRPADRQEIALQILGGSQ